MADSANKKKKIKHINVDEAFEEYHERSKVLEEGFRAVAMDFKHHIHGKSKDHEIYELKDSVMTRFFSADLHFELLVKQKFNIHNYLTRTFKENPKKIMNEVYPYNPILRDTQLEMSTIFDSIIYNLGSIFDYLSITVNYLTQSDRNQKPKWTQLMNISREKTKEFSKSQVAQMLVEINKEFVDKLFEYRSELIHKKMDNKTMHISIKKDGKIIPNYFVSEKFAKKFPELKLLNKDYNITVEFASIWVLNKTIDVIAKLLIELKEEFRRHSKFPMNFKNDDMIILHYDRETNRGLPPSTPIWKHFEEKIKKSNKCYE